MREGLKLQFGKFIFLKLQLNGNQDVKKIC